MLWFRRLKARHCKLTEILGSIGNTACQLKVSKPSFILKIISHLCGFLPSKIKVPESTRREQMLEFTRSQAFAHEAEGNGTQCWKRVCENASVQTEQAERGNRDPRVVTSWLVVFFRSKKEVFKGENCFCKSAGQSTGSRRRMLEVSSDGETRNAGWVALVNGEILEVFPLPCQIQHALALALHGHLLYAALSLFRELWSSLGSCSLGHLHPVHFQLEDFYGLFFSLHLTGSSYFSPLPFPPLFSPPPFPTFPPLYSLPSLSLSLSHVALKHICYIPHIMFCITLVLCIIPSVYVLFHICLNSRV